MGRGRERGRVPPRRSEPDARLNVDVWADLVVAEPGDTCPTCGGVLEGARGIEVRQVFQLGTKYSESMGATFTDEAGEEQPFLMGCYGVGVHAVSRRRHRTARGRERRRLARHASRHSRSRCYPCRRTSRSAPQPSASGASWPQAGVEVVLDDREERAGVKFADADLIGWPFQVVVGTKGLAAGALEVKDRATGERVSVALDDVVSHVSGLVADAKAALAPVVRVHPA